MDRCEGLDGMESETVMDLILWMGQDGIRLDTIGDNSKDGMRQGAITQGGTGLNQHRMEWDRKQQRV